MQDHSTIIDRSPSALAAKEAHVSKQSLNQGETLTLSASLMPK